MSWGEAMRLTERLALDPASHVAVSLQGWQRPVSGEALVLMDLFDLQHAKAAKKKPKPYPRPWVKPSVRTHGTARLSPAALRALLEAHTESEEGADHG